MTTHAKTVASEVLGALFVATTVVLVYIGFGMMVGWP
jgi:hypothetical protein